MNKTKMCLVQMWEQLTLTSYYIPHEVFTICPVLFKILDDCNGEKIHVKFMDYLFQLLDEGIGKKMIIRYEMLSGFLPLRSIVTKIINIHVDRSDNCELYSERVQNLIDNSKEASEDVIEISGCRPCLA